MYIYESHLGGLYTLDSELNFYELYCEQCGDYDWIIGYAATRSEAWELLKDRTDIDGCGGYDYNYVQRFLNERWDE